MQCCEYSILNASIASVSKLVWVQCWLQTRLELGQDRLLKALHHNGCECYRAVVVQAHWRGVFVFRYNCLGKG